MVSSISIKTDKKQKLLENLIVTMLLGDGVIFRRENVTSSVRKM